MKDKWTNNLKSEIPQQPKDMLKTNRSSLAKMFGNVNPFVPNEPFLCPLNTAKKEKECVGSKWVNNVQSQ